MDEGMEVLVQDMFVRLLDRSCSIELVRSVEEAPDEAPLSEFWDELEEAGLPNTLVDGEFEGFGLSISQALPVLIEMGARALPLPLGETMVARAILRRSGVIPPPGPIVLATSMTMSEDGTLRTAEAPLARTGKHALVEVDGGIALIGLDSSSLSRPGSRFSLSGCITAARSSVKVSLSNCDGSLRSTAAFLHAAKMVGAMQSVLRMTIEYAQTRSQFGRPIGKFQAIQQQISVMAEEVAAAVMAVELAAATGHSAPDPLAAAMSKERSSSAAVAVSRVAHAVFGAIGVSREHDLQLFTRRLAEWRVAGGAEGFWATEIGRTFFAADVTGAVDFVRTRMNP